MNTGPVSGPTASPARALLAGGAVPGATVGLLVAAVGLISSPAAMASALLGAGLASAAMAVGPVTMMIVQDWRPSAVLVAALTGYAIATLGAGLVFAIVSPQDWVRGGYAGWTLLATLIGWIAGQVRVVGRLRFLAFGNETPGDTPLDQGGTGGRTGSPESLRRAGH
jgi:hypothetical protein